MGSYAKIHIGTEKEGEKNEISEDLKVPIHYALTKTKLDKLNKLTARLTYAIQLISNLIDEQTEIDRPTLRKLVKHANISSKTGLSAGFIDQCMDKVLWSWKSYKKLHQDWERKAEWAKKKRKEGMAFYLLLWLIAGFGYLSNHLNLR
jgi:hypothetical protein